jgi:hypothetical protein
MFVLTLIGALVTLVFSGLMQAGAPESLPASVNGFDRPIFAVYFARSFDDLAFIAGPGAAAIREWMHGIQALDTWFPLAYGGMGMAFFAGLGFRGRKLAFLGVILAAGAIGADWAENEVANRILADLDAGRDPSDSLDAMWGHTWLKWGLIAAYSAFLSFLLASDGRRLLAIIPGLAAIAFLATYITGANPDVFRVTNYLLVAFMLTFPVAAVFYLRAPKES